MPPVCDRHVQLVLAKTFGLPRWVVDIPSVRAQRRRWISKRMWKELKRSTDVLNWAFLGLFRASTLTPDQFLGAFQAFLRAGADVNWAVATGVDFDSGRPLVETPLFLARERLHDDYYAKTLQKAGAWVLPSHALAPHCVRVRLANLARYDALKALREKRRRRALRRLSPSGQSATNACEESCSAITGR